MAERHRVDQRQRRHVQDHVGEDDREKRPEGRQRGGPEQQRGTREVQGDLSVKSKVESELKEQEGQLMARRYLADLKRQAIIDYK